MPKTPEISNGLQPDMFESPTPPAPKPASKVGPPNSELVEGFKKSRERLLTPTREPDIHEKFQQIKAEQIDLANQFEKQGISGIATITTPEQETELAERMEKDVSNPEKTIDVLAAYPRVRRGKRG